MKHLFCMLLALCLTFVFPTCGEETEADGRRYESGFCFSLWYDADRFAVDSRQDAERGLVERFQFRRGNVAAYLEMSALPEADGEDERWISQGLTPMDVYRVPELDLALPWRYACYGNDYLIVEEWIVTADNGVFAFVISRPSMDHQHWGEALFSILETLTFPPQSAENADLRLDFLLKKGEKI